jgi:hypothetical protein
MQTYITTHPLPVRFSFAGFNFPRYLAVLPTLRKGTLADLIKARIAPMCGPVYTFGGKSDGSPVKGWGGYLDNDGRASGLRTIWADEVEDVRISHTGWYTDDDGAGETMRGIVARLPRSRGFLAGWSMGQGMATDLEADVYETEREAAYAADDIAKRAAEEERDVQREQREEEEQEEEEHEEADAVLTAQLLEAALDDIKNLRAELETLKAAKPAPILGFDGFGLNNIADPYRSRVFTMATEYRPGREKADQGAEFLAALIASGVVTRNY